jgi:ATP-binding cassette, subfamily B, multidrug efflux pump
MSHSQPHPRTLKSYVIPHGRQILWGSLLSLLTVGLNVGIPFIARYLIDGLTAGKLDYRDLILWLGTYGMASLGSTALSYWMRAIPLRVGHRVETAIRGDLFDHLTRLERGFYRSQHTGDLMNRMSSDVLSVGMGIGQGLLQNFRMAFVFVLTFGVMFALSVPLATTILLLVPLMIGSFTWFAGRIKKGHIAVQEQLSDLSSFNQETFTGIQTLKSFAVEPRWRTLFQKKNEALMDKNLRMAMVNEGARPFAAFWFALSTVLILLLGGRLVIQGRLTLGELVQFNQYLLYMQWPLLSLGWILSLLQRSWASWVRIREVLDRNPAIADSADASTQPMPSGGDIVFDHVTLRAGETLLLADISLEIPAGTRVGITGPTGSGKTVLVSLLPRLWDVSSGSVKIGGRDVREWPLESLRKRIGMAEQEPMLFSDSLANNIGFGTPDPTEETILRAADIAHLHADVEQWPHQYETLVGERGISLSGGQRQRTSIGRAISRDPGILILDDVLASVDTETEAAILNKLQPVFSTRTTLFVSHRVSTLLNMDLILVVEAGRITQRGTHAELSRQPGYYRRLHEMQQLAAVI